MGDRAPAPRHGGAGRFSWAIRRAVAEARRDGFVSAVVVHDWQLRVTAKLHMHESTHCSGTVAAVEAEQTSIHVRDLATPMGTSCSLRSSKMAATADHKARLLGHNSQPCVSRQRTVWEKS